MKCIFFLLSAGTRPVGLKIVKYLFSRIFKLTGKASWIFGSETTFHLVFVLFISVFSPQDTKEEKNQDVFFYICKTLYRSIFYWILIHTYLSLYFLFMFLTFLSVFHKSLSINININTPTLAYADIQITDTWLFVNRKIEV